MMKILVLVLGITLTFIMLFCILVELPPRTNRYKEYFKKNVNICINKYEKTIMCLYYQNKDKICETDIVICQFSHTSEREKPVIQVYNNTILQFLDEIYIETKNTKQHTKVIHGLYDLINMKYGDNIWMLKDKYFLKNEKYLIIYKLI